MNVKAISTALAVALATGVCTFAQAASLPAPQGAVLFSAAAATGIGMHTANDHSASTVGQDGQVSLSFERIEEVVRSNNISIKAFDKTLKSVQETDIDKNYEEQYFNLEMQMAQYEEQIDELTQAIRNLDDDDSSIVLRQTLEAQRQALQSSLWSVRSSYGDLKDDKGYAKDKQKDSVTSTQRQLNNAADQLCMGAESTYISLHSLDASAKELDRTLAQLDRNIEVVKAQVRIGMSSELDLLSLQTQRESVIANRKTLETQRANIENSLAVLCGYGADTLIQVSSLPMVTETELSSLNYEKDLEEVLKNSYSIWSKEDAAQQASTDYANDVTDNLYTYEAAKIDRDAEKENVTNSFRQLYNSIQEKKALLEAAKADVIQAQKNFTVKKVQYERGALSKLDYTQAQDDLETSMQAVDTAQINLFTAYNQYKWAKRGVMSSNS